MDSLKRRYRSFPLTGQIALLGAVLAAFHFSNPPVLLVIEALALILLCCLRLDAGLLLAVACIPAANIFKHIGSDLFTPLEIIVLACTVAWATLHAPRFTLHAPRFTLHALRLTALDWAVLALVAAAALSLLAAADLPAAQWSLRILVIEPALLYLVIARSGVCADWIRGFSRSSGRCEKPAEASSPENVSPLHLADALVLGAIAVSLIGLYQFTFTDYVERAEGVRRILSIYDSPNHLGLFLGRVIPIMVATIAFAADRRRRIGYALALLPIAAALYLTFSRGAWLVGLPAGLLAIGLLRGRRTRIAVVALLILALLALLPFAGTPRFASLFDLQGGTSFNRLLIWQGSLRMIAAHPLWGVGIGNFVTQYGRSMLPEAWREPVIYHSHNVLLDFWAMLGISGVIALLGLVGACFRTGLAVYRRLADADQQALTLGLLASMAVFLGHGLVDTGYFLTDLAFLLMLTLGMLARLSAASSSLRGASCATKQSLPCAGDCFAQTARNDGRLRSCHRSNSPGRRPNGSAAGRGQALVISMCRPACEASSNACITSST